MIAVAASFALLAGLAHVGAFVVESLLFDRPRVRALLLGRAEVVPSTRLFAFNQGFYNLFLAVGVITGVVVWLAGSDTVGRTLVVFGCGAMALAGVVLYASNRRLWRGALGQIVPATVAVLATLLA